MYLRKLFPEYRSLIGRHFNFPRVIFTEYNKIIKILFSRSVHVLDLHTVDISILQATIKRIKKSTNQTRKDLAHMLNKWNWIQDRIIITLKTMDMRCTACRVSLYFANVSTLKMNLCYERLKTICVVHKLNSFQRGLQNRKRSENKLRIWNAKSWSIS